MSDAHGTTIQLFLADGTPDGLWVVDNWNWSGKALMSSRLHFAALRIRPELDGPGVYVLTGPPEGAVKQERIYIGETDVLRDRLDTQQKNKDFWTKVIAFTAKDDNLNKAYVRYLESRLISLAKEANRVELENGPATALPALSESERSYLERFLGNMLLIYPVRGVHAFEKPDEAGAGTTAPERLYHKGKDTKAEGLETSDGFLVYKGALARSAAVPSIHAYGLDLRESLTAAGVFVPEGEHLRLTEDHLFNSPSTAAMVLQGRTSNGRIEWKNAAGTSLKELQEQALDQD